jgi:hypothetical protein
VALLFIVEVEKRLAAAFGLSPRVRRA